MIKVVRFVLGFFLGLFTARYTDNGVEALIVIGLAIGFASVAYFDELSD